MRSSYRARAAVSAATLLLTFGVAGCEAEDPADPIASTREPIPPHSSSPTESVSPTDSGPVEPTLPTEAEAETEAGAEAFVEYYWEVVNYARQTGDVDLLRSLSVPNCGGCNGGIDAIERVYARGGKISGGHFEVLNSLPGRTPSGAWNVSTQVKVGRSKTTGAGDLNQSVRPGKLDFFFGLGYDDGAWHVTFLDLS